MVINVLTPESQLGLLLDPRTQSSGKWHMHLDEATLFIKFSVDKLFCLVTQADEFWTYPFPL